MTTGSGRVLTKVLPTTRPGSNPQGGCHSSRPVRCFSLRHRWPSRKSGNPTFVPSPRVPLARFLESTSEHPWLSTRNLQLSYFVNVSVVANFEAGNGEPLVNRNFGLTSQGVGFQSPRTSLFLAHPFYHPISTHPNRPNTSQCLNLPPKTRPPLILNPLQAHRNRRSTLGLMYSVGFESPS